MTESDIRPAGRKSVQLTYAPVMLGGVEAELEHVHLVALLKATSRVFSCTVSVATTQLPRVSILCMYSIGACWNIN